MAPLVEALRFFISLPNWLGLCGGDLTDPAHAVNVIRAGILFNP